MAEFDQNIFVTCSETLVLHKVTSTVNPLNDAKLKGPENIACHNRDYFWTQN